MYFWCCVGILLEVVKEYTFPTCICLGNSKLSDIQSCCSLSCDQDNHPSQAKECRDILKTDDVSQFYPQFDTVIFCTQFMKIWIELTAIDGNHVSRIRTIPRCTTLWYPVTWWAFINTCFSAMRISKESIVTVQLPSTRDLVNGSWMLFEGILK